MGSETRKARCTTLHACDSIKEKCSQNASIDPGRTSLLDSGDSKVMSADQERIHDGWLLHVDYSRTLTARENFYVYDFRLAGRRGIDATRSSRLAARGQVDRSFEDQYKKREANLRSSIVSCMDSDCMRKLWNRLAHTFTYFASLGFWQLIVLKVQHFSKLTRCICVWRHYAHARAVWCPWCTLGWLVTHMMSQWLQGQSKVGRGSVWRVAISQPRYLARSQWQSGGCSTHDTLGSVAAPLAMR
jgi:hypothetical protein